MLDFFPWIILNIFGIGLMWTILMTALKSTKFTEKMVGSLDKFAKNLVTTANIIPLAGGTSIAAIKDTADLVGSEIRSAPNQNARNVVSPWLENRIQSGSGRASS